MVVLVYMLTWYTGAICTQGPHHVAKKSTTINVSPDPFTTPSNSAYN